MNVFKENFQNRMMASCQKKEILAFNAWFRNNLVKNMSWWKILGRFFPWKYNCLYKETPFLKVYSSKMGPNFVHRTPFPKISKKLLKCFTFKQNSKVFCTPKLETKKLYCHTWQAHLCLSRYHIHNPEKIKEISQTNCEAL